MNRWPGGGEGWLTAKGYSWLTGRPAVDNGVTDGQSPLLTALFLWPDVSLLVTFLGHLPHAFSFLPLACDSKKKMAKKEYTTINRGNENSSFLDYMMEKE